MFEVAHRPRDLADWGALGGIVGRATNSYWEVPVVTGLEDAAQLRRAEALRRGAGELRLGGAVPHAGRHARGADAVGRLRRPRRRPPPSAIGKADFDAFYARLRGDGRQGRRGGVRRAAALADRDAAGCRPARRPARARGNVAGRHHLARDQVRRRPHGPDGPHRGRRRHRRGGRVLLPELRARDGGGQRLAAAAHQLGQARQHHRRLRLQADARQHGSAASTARWPGRIV